MASLQVCSFPARDWVLAQIKGVVPGSRLEVRPRPETIATGIPQVDELTGGVPRGGLTEIFGPPSSGRTSLLLALLAQVTVRGQVCALVDASDAFDPYSAQAAGVDLQRLLWVRCGEKVSRSSFVSRKNRAAAEKRETRNEKLGSVEQALHAADLLLEAGGFGLVVMDLGDTPPAIVARRVPLTSWFRFRRVVENTATALVVVEQKVSAKSCASLVLRTRHSAISTQHSVKTARTKPSHARLFGGMHLEVEVLNSRILQRKPARSATASFESRALWFG